MKNLKQTVLTGILLLAFVVANAQEFATPSMSFSRKKPMYVTLADGTEIVGNLKKFKYEKSLIEELVIIDSTEKKIKIMPEDIAFMYVAPSGLENMSRVMDFASDATKWNNPDIDTDIINKGYIYFEQSEVIIKKKKTEVLLMQLLNPTFSKTIKVYHDPRAKETASFSPGGVTVAGGDAKSYYIKKGDKPAVKVEKKTYEEDFPVLFSDCEAVTTKYNEEVKWGQINEHTLLFTQECE